MTEMVERVARALCRSKSAAQPGGWIERHINENWRLFEDDAKTAILAMREPTEGMCAAGQQVNNLSEEPGHFEFLSRDETAAAWQAMINEALK